MQRGLALSSSLSRSSPPLLPPGLATAAVAQHRVARQVRPARRSTTAGPGHRLGRGVLPGQQLKYAIDVFNNDVGCGSSTFTVRFSAPNGFSVSMPSTTITLSSASSGYVWANVTSPATAADGDYPLTATLERATSSSPAATSSYKVYSSDTVAPKLFWTDPSDGGALSGRTTYVGFTSSDDHAVKKLEVSLDGVSVASALCDNISSDCQVSYKWSIRRVHGTTRRRTGRPTGWGTSPARRRPSPSTDRRDPVRQGAG